MKTIPPLKKAHPRTRSMFDKIDPNSDCCTTRISPLCSAWTDIINSVAFPKVAFKRPPTRFGVQSIKLDIQPLRQFILDYALNLSLSVIYLKIKNHLNEIKIKLFTCCSCEKY